MLQRLQDLLYEQAQNCYLTLPIIRHRRLQKIVDDAALDLDKDELQQVTIFYVFFLTILSLNEVRLTVCCKGHCRDILCINQRSTRERKTDNKLTGRVLLL